MLMQHRYESVATCASPHTRREASSSVSYHILLVMSVRVNTQASTPDNQSLYWRTLAHLDKRRDQAYAGLPS
ncbi:MAG TPA: hypothetical protein VKR83_09900 [Ktedonobacteraceae bacterium]|nr:hypothetical protein [Ktedonobacteraceae bacterium]